MTYKLKKATLNDKDKLIAYKLASILDYAKNLEKDEEEKIKNYVYNSIPKEINNYQIIEIQNHNVGCLLIEKYQDGILLNEIYLEEEYRHQGIGTKILLDILNNHPKVYLWVYQENQNALKLYQKLGFKIKETTDSRYFMAYSQ